MRRSEAAVALICRRRDGQDCWLAQWNRKWRAYHFVSGHRREGESFRECLVREIAEELRLVEGTDYGVSAESSTHLEFVSFSQSVQTQTRYIMELFTVKLHDTAHLKVEADPANRWLTDAEIQLERTEDAHAVSSTMRRLVRELRSEEKL